MADGGRRTGKMPVAASQRKSKRSNNHNNNNTTATAMTTTPSKPSMAIGRGTNGHRNGSASAHSLVAAESEDLAFGLADNAPFYGVTDNIAKRVHTQRARIVEIEEGDEDDGEGEEEIDDVTDDDDEGIEDEEGEEGEDEDEVEDEDGDDGDEGTSLAHQHEGEEDGDEGEADGEGDGEGGEKQIVPRRLVYTRPTAETITVECSDEGVIEIEKAVAVRMSVAIRKRLESLEANSIIQLENITGRALTKVMEYCHVHTAPHVISMDLKHWDDKFVKLDPGTLCELASAAYHLEIKPLVDLTCQAIAQLLKGKSPAEIRRTFNILYDFNPEDDAPPPTMRDKLRNKLCNPKRREKAPKPQLLPPPKTETDTRSVDDLVSFINEGTSGKPAAKGKGKAAKRARQRERKKQKKPEHTHSGERELKRSRDGADSQPLSPHGKNQQPTSPRNKQQPLSPHGKQSTNTHDKQPLSPHGKQQVTSPRDTNAGTTQTSRHQDNHTNGNTVTFAEPIEDADNSTTIETTAHLEAYNSSNGKKKSSQPATQSTKKSKNLSNSAPDLRKNKTRKQPIRLTDDASATDDPLSCDDVIWNDEDEEDEDDMDPEMKAQQDKEVEEFRRRLEQINNTQSRARIALPSTLSLALIDSLKG